MIAAMDTHRGIGLSGKIPWHIKEDLIRFKEKTIGKTVIMGKKTFESVLSYYEKSKNPIPNRKHIVVTHDQTYTSTLPNTHIAHSLEEAIEIAKTIEPDEVLISGGGQLFSQGISYADKLYLTIVDGVFEVDTYFPEYENNFHIVQTEKKRNDTYTYTFIELDKNL